SLYLSLRRRLRPRGGRRPARHRVDVPHRGRAARAHLRAPHRAAGRVGGRRLRRADARAHALLPALLRPGAVRRRGGRGVRWGDRGGRGPRAGAAAAEAGGVMRLFVAVTPPPEAVAELSSATAAARAAHPRLRWTRPDQWHLTLAFLGTVGAEAPAGLVNRLARAAALHPPLRPAPPGAGPFGGRAPGRRR